MEVFTERNKKGDNRYGVITPGGTQWDVLNEAQKAVIHEYSNGK